MGERSKIEARTLTPMSLHSIGGLVLSFRDIGLRHVGNPSLDFRQARVVLLDLGLERTDLFLERFHLLQNLGRGFSLHRGDFVAATPLLFEPRDRLAPKPIELDEALESGAGVPLGKLGEQSLGVRAKKLAW
jgi:hypothetical protein